MSFAFNIPFKVDRGKTTPTARDYVQDGLLSAFDGIENVGWGVHESSSTKWHDLIRGSTIDGVTFDSNGVLSNGGKVGTRIGATGDNNYFAVIFDSEYTIETVLSIDDVSSSVTTTDGRIGMQALTGSSSFAFGKHWDRPFYVWPYGFSNYAYYAGDFRGSTIHLGVSWRKTGDSEFFYGGASTGVKKSDGLPYQNKNYESVISDENKGIFGKYHSIRIYSRALTAEEIAANYAIDKARFNLP